jgi:23S rRNA (uracil1939-C5)-methyltransferase
MPLAQLNIESIAAGGDGVGRANGMVVFVPRTAPGDIVDVAYDAKEGARFARGTVRALRAASALRVEPPCAHYIRDRCGGCQLQHLDYSAQLEAKGAVVRDAIQRIARRATDAPSVRPSMRQWRYRRKLTLALRASGTGWLAGLHPYDAPARVFQLRECPITEDRVVAVWHAVLAAGDALPRAAELRGAVRFDDDDAASLVVEGGDHWPTPARLLERVPALDAIWWAPNGTRTAAACVASRRPAVAPAAAFAQVNASVAAHLTQHVIERVLAYEPAQVVDAYAGVGVTAIALATPSRRVTAIELDAGASARCAARLPAGSRAIEARVEDALESALPTDVVILNPPRAGVDRRVTECLAHAAPAPRALVYVSCDPATLARDLGRLPTWRIASLVSFDMFPQTAHVETVCELVPDAA